MKQFKGRVITPGAVTAEAVVTKEGFNTLASLQMALQFGDKEVKCGDQSNKELYGKPLLGKALCLWNTFAVYDDTDHDLSALLTDTKIYMSQKSLTRFPPQSQEQYFFFAVLILIEAGSSQYSHSLLSCPLSFHSFAWCCLSGGIAVQGFGAAL